MRLSVRLEEGGGGLGAAPGGFYGVGAVGGGFLKMEQGM